MMTCRAFAVALWVLSSCPVLVWAQAQKEATLENKTLRLAALPGQSGVAVYLTSDAASKRMELALLAAGAAKSAPIATAGVVKNSSGQSLLRVSAGTAEAEFSLGSAGFVKINPGKNAAIVEVRTGARYTVLPDFFADDVFYDPVHLAMPAITVPAENFLLQFVEGGSTMVMCLWPGRLKQPEAKGVALAPKAAAASKAEADVPDQQVDLIFTGEGKARRISAARIEFQKKPVYAGIIEQKGIWQDEDVSAMPASRSTAIAWKRPFEARWRGDFVVAEGKRLADWQTRIQSYDFHTPSQGERYWQESLMSWFSYPAMIRGNDVCLNLYVDRAARGKPHVYERVIIYPLGRAEATPPSVFTPMDLMRETLGQEPCEYILDLAGIKPRLEGGDRKLLAGATCGLWSGHIRPIVGKIKKKPDGSYEPLDEKTKAHLIQAIEDMWAFIYAVHNRLMEYKKWGADLETFCKKESAKNPKLKPIADLTLERLGRINADFGRHKFEGPGSIPDWKNRIPELLKKVKEDNYADVGTMATAREIGGDQDMRVSRCRQYVKGLQQEIGFQDTSDPSVRAFAVEVRDRCHRMLRNMHPKEGL
jgi:hypothetical protein